MKSAAPISGKVKALSCVVTFVLLFGTVAMGSNLMNRIFPYEGERTVMGIVIPDCPNCQVRTVYQCKVESALFDVLLDNKGSGVYMQYIFQCPKCVQQKREFQFLREFTEIELSRYQIYLERAKE